MRRGLDEGKGRKTHTEKEIEREREGGRNIKKSPKGSTRKP